MRRAPLVVPPDHEIPCLKDVGGNLYHVTLNSWCETLLMQFSRDIVTTQILLEFRFLPRLQNSRVFFSKSVRKSVKRGVRVLHARSARASHPRRACEARGKKPYF